MLVGNKLDAKRKVTFEEAEKFAKKLGMPYIETSAMNRIGVDETFMRLARKVHKKIKDKSIDPYGEHGIHVGDNDFSEFHSDFTETIDGRKQSSSGQCYCI